MIVQFLFVLAILAAAGLGWADVVKTTVLLADIADVFAQLNISLSYAAIATFDERVEDSFLIRHPQLADTAFQLKLERMLLERIGG